MDQSSCDDGNDSNDIRALSCNQRAALRAASRGRVALLLPGKERLPSENKALTLSTFHMDSHKPNCLLKWRQHRGQ